MTDRLENSGNPFEKAALRVAEAVREAGGRGLLVGGFVRDRLLGLAEKDADVEVFGLPAPELEALLARLGRVDAVGRSFGVLKVLVAFPEGPVPLDVSLPRTESKTGRGHKGFLVTPEPGLSFKDAAQRRDFTINAIGLDPLTGEILDPWNGRADLAARRLAMVDPATFVEDPLRVLRAAQFLARFDLVPDPALVVTSRGIRASLLELPAERLWEEWVKLLLKGTVPSKGLAFLLQTGALETLHPELFALAGCPQDPEWHPEGDVFVHTAMALDAAVARRTGEAVHDLTLMLGVLAHDLGKPPTTRFEDGRWRARGHEAAGLPPTTAFLERLKAPHAFLAPVCALVADHLAPAHLSAGTPTARTYRRLARKLSDAGTTMEMLHAVAESDHFGRTTPDALAREFPAGDAFLAAARSLDLEKAPVVDVVLGRHVLARGIPPGRRVGELLARCRDVVDETGWTDPERILDRALAAEN